MPKNSSAARREQARRLAADEGITYTAALRRIDASHGTFAGFFEPPVSQPQSAETDGNRLPWQGPPDDMQGGLVPVGAVAGRSDMALIEVRIALAFPDGCLFDVYITVRNIGRNKDTWWPFADALGFGSGRDQLRAGELADDLLRFGVSFADGTKATTLEHAFSGRDADSDPPQPPVLTLHFGSSSNDSRILKSHHPLWLWPLPPPQPFDLVTEWPIAGIDLTTIPLDGAAIATAAEHAQAYWPDDQS